MLNICSLASSLATLLITRPGSSNNTNGAGEPADNTAAGRNTAKEGVGAADDSGLPGEHEVGTAADSDDMFGSIMSKRQVFQPCV